VELALIYRWFKTKHVKIKKMQDSDYCEYMSERKTCDDRAILPMTYQQACTQVLEAEENLAQI